MNKSSKPSLGWQNALRQSRSIFGPLVNLQEVEPRTKIYQNGQFFVTPNYHVPTIYGQGRDWDSAIESALSL